MFRVSNSGLFVVLMLAALGFAARGATAGGWHLPVLFAQTAPTATTSPGADTATTLHAGEESFLQDATVGARAATELARLAMSQASTSTVRDLAQQMVGDYTQINDTLESLARRKAVPLPLSPTGFSSDVRQLSTQTGSGFDQAFIRVTTATSQRELRLFETAVANAKDADVRDVAGSLLPVLRNHVNKLTELQKGL
jgi:putative membrane protein